MKYFSTFSGIGGFELGITQAYETKILIRDGQTKTSRPDGKEQGVESTTEGVLSNRDIPDNISGGDTGALSCVGYSEIDKYAASIYQAHFPNHKNYGDITKINEKELPDFDLLVGGFPCQSFSIAGKRGGFDDTRGTMFFELARIIKEKLPRLFVFENVKGLLSHDQGKTFTTIITTLDELGYDCQWQVLNSKNHGVPQNRERVFIIGHLRGTRRPKVFPFIGESGKDFKISPDKLVEYSARHETRMYDKVAPTVQSAFGTGGGHVPFVNGIRKLTPTECERLQGFPDGWTKTEVLQTSKIKEMLGVKKYMSDTQRYKTLGNAVTVNVIEDIFTKILFGDN